MRIWNRATGEPWAITEGALQTILEVASRENDSPEAVAARLGRELNNSYVTQERDGVAILPVVGPLFRYANLFTSISGASSYEILAKDFTTALENPDIKGIVLDIDSPGGEVNGCAEFANMIYEARGTKPIIAYASGDAASGAYWIASACDQIIVSETSALGSIGVVAVYRSRDEQSAQAVEIVSSQSPNKRLDPESDEGRARLQSRIDTMAQVFVETVARNRGVDPPKVINDFGAGDVLIGRKSIQSGLADKTGSLEKIINTLSDSKSDNPASVPGSSFVSEEKRMDIETLNEQHPELAASLIAQGQQLERERIAAIINADIAVGREPLARHLAFATDMRPESALEALNTTPLPEPKQPNQLGPGSGFDRVMAEVGNPDIEPASDDQEEDIDAVAQRLAAYQ